MSRCLIGFIIFVSHKLYYRVYFARNNRITAYHSDEDISVILDSNGKFESLWDFSSFLVAHGFKIIVLTHANRIAETTFPAIEPSNKIGVRAIAKGLPEIQDFPYQNRKCKAITVGDKVYGQFMD